MNEQTQKLLEAAEEYQISMRLLRLEREPTWEEFFDVSGGSDLDPVGLLEQSMEVVARGRVNAREQGIELGRPTSFTFDEIGDTIRYWVRWYT